MTNFTNMNRICAPERNSLVRMFDEAEKENSQTGSNWN